MCVCLKPPMRRSPRGDSRGGGGSVADVGPVAFCCFSADVYRAGTLSDVGLWIADQMSPGASARDAASCDIANRVPPSLSRVKLRRIGIADAGDESCAARWRVLRRARRLLGALPGQQAAQREHQREPNASSACGRNSDTPAAATATTGSPKRPSSWGSGRLGRLAPWQQAVDAWQPVHGERGIFMIETTG